MLTWALLGFGDGVAVSHPLVHSAADLVHVRDAATVQKACGDGRAPADDVDESDEFAGWNFFVARR